MRWQVEELDALDSLLLRGPLELDPSHVTIRVDPIQRWTSRDAADLHNEDLADRVLELASSRGYRRFRTSAIVIGRYARFIRPRSEALGLVPHVYSTAEVSAIAARLAAAAGRLGADLTSCACSMPPLPAGACFDPAWMATLAESAELREALATPSSDRAVAPRAGCRCVWPEGATGVKITRKATCPIGCAACYAG